MPDALMTAEDAALIEHTLTDMAAVVGEHNLPGNRLTRILATYAECARLRAALTEREGECERGKALRDALEAGAKHVPLDGGSEVTVMNFTLIQDKGTHPADSLIRWHQDNLDAARGPRTGGDND